MKLIRRMFFLPLLGVWLPIAFATPTDGVIDFAEYEQVFNESTCGRYLDAVPRPTDEAFAKAREYLAWMTLAHPTQRVAFRSSDDLDLVGSLIHLPLGFAMIPPENQRWFKRPLTSRTYRRLITYYPDHRMEIGTGGAMTRKEIRERLVWQKAIISAWAGARVENKLATVSSLLNMSLNVLSQLIKSEHWLETAGEIHPRLKMNVQLYSAKLEDSRHIRFDWPKSFAANDRATLVELRAAMDRDDVRSIVFHYLVKKCDEVVKHFLETCRTLDRCTAVTEAQAALQNMKDVGGLNDLGQPWRVWRTFALSSPDNSRSLEPPPIPSDLPPLQKIAPFDPEEINAFLAASCVDAATTIDRIDLTELWRDLQRAADLSNAVFAQFDVLTGTERWAQWANRVEDGGDWLKELRLELSETARANQETLLKLDRATAAVARLRSWLEVRRIFLSDVTRDKARTEALGPHEIQVLQTILTFVPRLAGVLERSESALRSRQRVEFRRSSAYALLMISIGTELQRWTMGAGDERSRSILLDALRAAAADPKPEVTAPDGQTEFDSLSPRDVPPR